LSTYLLHIGVGAPYSHPAMLSFVLSGQAFETFFDRLLKAQYLALFMGAGALHLSYASIGLMERLSHKAFLICREAVVRGPGRSEHVGRS